MRLLIRQASCLCRNLIYVIMRIRVTNNARYIYCGWKNWHTMAADTYTPELVPVTFKTKCKRSITYDWNHFFSIFRIICVRCVLKLLPSTFVQTLYLTTNIWSNTSVLFSLFLFEVIKKVKSTISRKLLLFYLLWHRTQQFELC